MPIDIKELKDFILDTANIDLKANAKEQYAFLDNKYGSDILIQYVTLLQKVNKNKIKTIYAINNREKKQLNHNSNKDIFDAQQQYSQKEVKQIFENKSSQYIEKHYTKSNLNAMYSSLIGEKPLSHSNKKQIISNIKTFFSFNRRSENLVKNYQ